MGGAAQVDVLSSGMRCRSRGFRTIRASRGVVRTRILANALRPALPCGAVMLILLLLFGPSTPRPLHSAAPASQIPHQPRSAMRRGRSDRPMGRSVTYEDDDY